MEVEVEVVGIRCLMPAGVSGKPPTRPRGVAKLMAFRDGDGENSGRRTVRSRRQRATGCELCAVCRLLCAVGEVVVLCCETVKARLGSATEAQLCVG